MQRYLETCHSPIFSNNIPSSKLQRFFTFIYNSDLDSAKQILLSDPRLILKKNSIGAYKNLNGLELAWNLGDAGMCAMMVDLADSKGIVVEISESTNKNPAFDPSHFEEIAEVIIASDYQSVSDELYRHHTHKVTSISKAMDDFRGICDKHGEMSPQDVVNAFLVLEKYAAQLDRHDGFRLYFAQVIGYVERLTPVWFRQALIQGILNLQEPNAVLHRAANHVVDNIQYPVIDLEPCRGLGFKFACDVNGARGRAAMYWIGGRENPIEKQSAIMISKYLAEAEEKLAEIKQHCTQSIAAPESQRFNM